MKKLKLFTVLTLTATVLAAPLVGRAEDKKETKAKPYSLEKCIVSDEKLGEMGKPFVFVHEGQARAHLHELWLRELECWVHDARGLRRLDADYHPTPTPPDWARRLDASSG